jgi:hypothetical protein
MVTMTVVVFGIIPAVTALTVLIVSVYSVLRAFGVLQVVLGIPTVYLTLMSLLVLKRMFFDRAWPTYWPYLAISLAVPLALTQWYLARRRDSSRRAVSTTQLPPERME